MSKSGGNWPEWGEDSLLLPRTGRRGRSLRWLSPPREDSREREILVRRHSCHQPSVPLAPYHLLTIKGIHIRRHADAQKQDPARPWTPRRTLDGGYARQRLGIRVGKRVVGFGLVAARGGRGGRGQCLWRRATHLCVRGHGVFVLRRWRWSKRCVMRYAGRGDTVNSERRLAGPRDVSQASSSPESVYQIMSGAAPLLCPRGRR